MRAMRRHVLVAHRAAARERLTQAAQMLQHTVLLLSSVMHHHIVSASTALCCWTIVSCVTLYVYKRSCLP